MGHPLVPSTKICGLSPPGECHRNPAALPFMPAAETPLARIEVLKELLRRRVPKGTGPSGWFPCRQLTRCRVPTNCEIGGSGSGTDFASTSLWDGESTPLCCACQVSNTTYCISSALPPALRENQNCCLTDNKLQSGCFERCPPSVQLDASGSAK